MPQTQTIGSEKENSNCQHLQDATTHHHPSNALPLTLLLAGAPPNWKGVAAECPSLTSNELFPVTGAELPKAGTLLAGDPNIPGWAAAVDPKVLVLLPVALPNNDGVLSEGLAAAVVAPNGLALPNDGTVAAAAPKAGVPLLIPPNSGAGDLAASVDGAEESPKELPLDIVGVAPKAKELVPCGACEDAPKTLVSSGFAGVLANADPKAKVALGGSLVFVSVTAGAPKAIGLIADKEFVADEVLPNSGWLLSEVVAPAAAVDAPKENVGDAAAAPKPTELLGNSFAKGLATSFAGTAPNRGVIVDIPPNRG